MRRFKTKTVISVDYNDLEDVIREFYGHEYEILPMEEIGSSQYAATTEMTVKKGDLDKWAYKGIEALKAGNPEQYSLSYILQDLANNGEIPEGDYMIGINW